MLVRRLDGMVSLSAFALSAFAVSAFALLAAARSDAESPATLPPPALRPPEYPSAPPPPMSDFRKGIAYTAWYNGLYSDPLAEQTLANVVKPLGVNWIEVLALGRQETISSTEITTDPQSYSPTDGDLTRVIERAHALGLRVLLKPHVDLANDPKHWRGEITAGTDDASRDAWFADYAKFITHYAALAQSAGADSFAIGTELHATTRHSDHWRAVARAVRDAYKGEIVYASYWLGATKIDWWDCVDVIGVDAYYPLQAGADPSVERLAEAWAPTVARLGELSMKWNRPVVFTEIGYRSMDGAHANSENWQTTGPVNLREQANCYEAVFRAFADKDWFRGVFWWSVNTDPTIPGGPNNTDYTPLGKPAEQILRARFGGQPAPNPS